MPIELWTLDDSDESVEEVIAVFRLALGAAEESEIMHPERVSALRQWCNAEYKRLHPAAPTRRMTRLEEIKASLARSPHAQFWEHLAAGQEVRWTGTKTATYFVVDPVPSLRPPANDDEDGYRIPEGQYIELRRHTGKTFWTYIGKVRPL